MSLENRVLAVIAGWQPVDGEYQVRDGMVWRRHPGVAGETPVCRVGDDMWRDAVKEAKRKDQG